MNQSSPDTDLHHPSHFEDTLPEDAMLMSRDGTALGYDFLRFGEKWDQEGMGSDRAVVRIDATGVQFLAISDDKRKWIEEAGDDRQEINRRTFQVRRASFVPWGELSELNRNFLLSLLWLPSDPLTAMEIIAKMADA